MKKITLLFALAAITMACSNDNASQETAATTEVAEASGNGDAGLAIASSKLKWTGKKLTGEHFGTIQISKGNLILEGNTLTGGSFTIDMKTIVVEDLTDPGKNKDLTDHLFSDDFFSVANHPEATFTITGVEALATPDAAGNTHTIAGNLTIKGITQGIRFPANVLIDDLGVTAKANFNIDRTLWDIKFKSGKFFPELGDKAISDEIGIALELSTAKS